MENGHLANSWWDLPLIEWGLKLSDDWLAPKDEATEDNFDTNAAAKTNKEPVMKPGNIWLHDRQPQS